ncbi:hypothetical protein DAI22_03g072466 [Oryza sativa Japonica Group]|nr:hypothetical protein DAI22_03g072466 [Oryza sativa Japonica Group]
MQDPWRRGGEGSRGAEGGIVTSKRWGRVKGRRRDEVIRRRRRGGDGGIAIRPGMHGGDPSTVERFVQDHPWRTREVPLRFPCHRELKRRRATGGGDGEWLAGSGTAMMWRRRDDDGRRRRRGFSGMGRRRVAGGITHDDDVAATGRRRGLDGMGRRGGVLFVVGEETAWRGGGMGRRRREEEGMGAPGTDACWGGGAMGFCERRFDRRIVGGISSVFHAKEKEK